MSSHEIKALVPWALLLDKIGIDSGQRGRTRCLVHNGDNPASLSYDEKTGRAYCFSCNWHGDKIDFLQKVLAVDFKTALARLASIAGVQLDNYKQPSSAELRRIRAHRVALNSALNAYRGWQRQKFNELIAVKFHDMLPDLQAAEIAVRAIHRRPDLYSKAEQRFWSGQLSRLYDLHAKVEFQLDILSLRAEEESRFWWWRQEQ